MIKDLLYVPELTPKEIRENHKSFVQRASLYKKRGINFLKNREFVVKVAQPIQGSMLEIGTGTGHTTLVLAKAGYRFISIDNDREALKVAALNLAYEKVLSNVIFYVMDGRSLGFAPGGFNNIVIANLLHHVEDADTLFSEADRVLSADGKLILSDFNKEGMEIVSSVHKDEGRAHMDSGVREDSAYSYFRSRQYEIKRYSDKYHWILLTTKK